MHWISKLAHRSNQAELMDELTLGNEDLRRNLEELAFINRWLGGNQLTLNGLEQTLARHPVPRLAGWRIADLGCGGGDMLALMARWARRKNVDASLVGIDANGFMLDYAKKNTAAHPGITYLQQNVFSEDFSQHTFDVVTCTLFCHHFDSGQLVGLLRQLRQQTRVSIILNDLHRHWLAYYAIAWLTRWFSSSYLVKHDAKLSVWRAFHRHELTRIIADAGFTNFRIRWRWAFRWEVVIFV